MDITQLLAEKKKRNLLQTIGQGMLGFASGYRDPVSTFKQLNEQGSVSGDDLLKMAMMQQMGMIPQEAPQVGAPTAVTPPPQTGSMPPAFQNMVGGGNPLMGGIPPTQYNMPMSMGIKQDPLNAKLQESAINVQENALKKQTEQREKIDESKLSNIYNMEMVGGALKDYYSLLSQAHNKGAAGDIYQAKIGDAVMRGFVPGEIAKSTGMDVKYREAAAAIGKKEEIVMKMFPMLTQQIGKEGSIRMIESVMNRIGKTLPGIETPFSTAGELGKQSILTLYRVQRALETVDADFSKYKGKDGEKKMVEMLADRAKAIKISPEEQKFLDQYTDSILGDFSLKQSKDGWTTLPNGVRIREKAGK